MDLSGEWDYIEEIARQRLSNNKSRHHVSRYGDGIETIGAAGELAARRCLNLSESLHIRRDNGIDILWRGWRVDVKTTKLTPRIQHRFLQWPKDKPIKCDIVLMVAVDTSQKSAELLGFAFAYEIMCAPVNYSRDFPCHEIPVGQLIPIERFFDIEAKSSRYRRPQVRGSQKRREVLVWD